MSIVFLKPKPKKRKKIFFFISLFCAVACLTGLFGLTVFSDTSTSIYFDPQTQQVDPGEEFFVAVKVSNAQDLYSFQIGFEYDDSLLEYQGVTQGNFLKQGGVSTFEFGPALESDKVLGYGVSRTSASAGVSGSGTLAIFYFKAKQTEGVSQIKFITSGAGNSFLENSQFIQTSFNKSNGQAQIGEGGDDGDGNGDIEPPSSQEAEFNTISNRDRETLRVKNRTSNNSYWSETSISAETGDSIAFNVYYHNVNEASVAENTKIKLVLSQASSQQIKATVYLSADNADTEVDSIYVNLPEDSFIELNNKAKWYPNRTTSNPTYLTIASPQSQTYQITLGDIKGCWEYQGQVIFEADIGGSGSSPAPQEPPSSEIPSQTNFTLLHQIANLTYSSGYQTTINSLPQNRISIEITIKASEGALTNVVARNILPEYLEYEVSSLKIEGGISYGGSIFKDGMKLGSLSSGSLIKVSFRAKVKTVAVGEHTFQNKVYVKADNASEKEAITYIKVSYTGCSPYLTGPSPDVV